MLLIRAVTALAITGLCTQFTGCASVQDDTAWPERIVGINSMRATQRIQTSMLISSIQASPAGTVVLKLHVDDQGKVVKTVILESNGTPRMDGAALGAMRKMKFLPYTLDGIATPVTVIAPMHFPAIN